MKTISHPSLTKLIENVQLRIPELKSGTYNRQDPTHFEYGSIKYQYTESLSFTIEYEDVTWGVTIKLIVAGKLVTKIYFSADGFYNRNSATIESAWFKRWYKVLFEFVKDTDIVPEKTREYWEDYEEDPMGCLADYI